MQAPSIRTPVRIYRTVLETIFALLPGFAILYLHVFSADEPPLRNYAIHELAIALALILSGFVALITWRCYQASGAPFLRWLALGFLGFTLVYLPHGALTRASEHNIWLLLLYGPVARASLMSCLLIALLHTGRPADPESERASRGFLFKGLGVFLAIDLLVALLALSPYADNTWLYTGGELAALILMLASAAILIARHEGSPLMRVYLISVAAFAQASLSFLLLASPWNHQWWLAHVIFAAGLLLLSYGMVQAYLASGSSISVYSLEEVFEQLRKEKARTEDAMQRLETANRNLETMATTDALTGLYNRRHFSDQANRIIERSSLDHSPASLLMLDLDWFKQVNDTYGHQIGDTVLSCFADILRSELRPEDLCGRFGGEEFLILLPHSTREQSLAVAERLRRAVATTRISVQDKRLQITVSIGVAHADSGSDTLESLLQRADRNLYLAKAKGRDRIHCDTPPGPMQ